MRLALLAVLVLCSCASASPFDAVEPAKLPFSYEVPLIFKPAPDLVWPRGCIAAYSDGRKSPVFLYVCEQRNVMAQGKPFVPGPHERKTALSVFRENWRGIAVFATRDTEEEGTGLAVFLSVYVPLKDRTICLQAVSWVQQEPDALWALRYALGHASGETSWQPDASPESRGFASPPQYDNDRRSDWAPYSHPYERSKTAPREGSNVRSSINQLFWASFYLALPVALIGGLVLIRRRGERGFTATRRPLYREIRGWGGPVPRPRKT